MEGSPKTISFRADEETFEKIEQLKKNLFEGRETSNSEVLRYAINYLENHYGRGIADTDKFLDLVKSYIKAAFLNDPSLNFSGINEVLNAVEVAYEEHYVEEIEEIGKLYNEEEPITVAQLVRFKHKTVPLNFLKNMGVDEEEIKDLSNDDLADLLLKKFSEEEFKKKAKTKFHIDC